MKFMLRSVIAAPHRKSPLGWLMWFARRMLLAGYAFVTGRDGQLRQQAAFRARSRLPEWQILVESGHQRCHDAAMRDVWTGGYKAAELAEAQERYGLRFPPDLIDLLLDRRPVDWWDSRSDDLGIRSALKHPLEGLLFDLEHNGLWWPEWGERPTFAGDRAAILTSIVDAAPRLIPLYSHRYIPETPQEAGNPVFSVMQSDVIDYGANLADYIANEIGSWQQVSPIRHIPFWSDLVDRNC